MGRNKIEPPPPFKVRMRVRMTELCPETGSPRTGSVVRGARNGMLVVLRKGTKWPCEYSPSYWEPDPAAPTS